MKPVKQVLLLFTLTAITLAGCGNTAETSGSHNSENGDGTESTEPEVTDVTLRLNWNVKGEFAPFFVTKEMGIFEDYGLNVDILEGNGSTTTMQAVAQGQDDFGVTSTVEPAQGLAQGMPIKMVASYMNRSPIMIGSHPDTPVESPQDLEGKRISMSIDSTFTNVFPYFLSTNGVDESAVQAVQVETSARNGLFLGEDVDAVAIFSTNEKSIFEKELGYELVPLYLADYSYDLAGLTLISNNRFLEDNPETTRRFLAAIDEGFTYTLENPAEAAEILKKHSPDAIDVDITEMQLEEFREIALFDGVPNGFISEENIIDTLDILEESQLIEQRLDADEYFTNEFLPQD